MINLKKRTTRRYASTKCMRHFVV